jgi:hypothetical protein
MVSCLWRALRCDRLRLLAAAALVAYTAMVSVSPALHHDLVCHVKSPTHCDACLANPLAARAKTATPIPAPPLLLAGQAPSLPERHRDRVAAAPASGRSPPA